MKARQFTSAAPQLPDRSRLRPLAAALTWAVALSASTMLASCSLGGDAASQPGSSPSSPGGTSARPGPDQITGLALTESAAPVFGATVRIGGSAAVTDGEGRFVLDRPSADSVLTVSTDTAYGYVPVDAQVDEEVRITLHPAPAGSAALRFGGEVRTGRSMLPRSAEAAEYADALAGVAPLLSAAQVAAVTLAGPLAPDPWGSEQDASSAQLARGLSMAGVDVVALSTDRITDAGRDGVGETIDILMSADLKVFGAGRDLKQAWAPATLDLGGRTAVYLGCQIGSPDSPWAAGKGRAGAAPCVAERLDQAIRSAGRDGETVIAFIRDDRPYDTVVGPEFSALVKRAVRAGATVIVGGGTHVAGEVWDFGDATAVQSLGDLLTDDATWASRDGFLLRTDVDGGRAVSIGAEPLTRTDGLPSLVRGDLAEEISRIAAADINDGPLVLAGDIAVVSTGTWTIDQTTASAEPDDDGPPLELGDGWWLPPSGQQGVSAGFDLVPTGTFEDIDADPATDGAIGWLLGPGARLVAPADGTGGQSAEEVCEGSRAVRMKPAKGRDATIFTAGAVPLPRVRAISAYVSVRDLGDAGLRGRMRLQWSAGGSSVGEDSIRLAPQGTGCSLVRLDTVPPSDADAVRVVLDLRSGEALVDDLHVVGWTRGSQGGRRFSRLRVFEPVQVTLVVDVPRGAQAPPGPFRPAPVD